MTSEEEVLEQLAELEHLQWWTWANELVTTEKGLSKERIERWRKYFVSYKNLPEEIKESDRVWARKVLEIIKRFKDDN